MRERDADLAEDLDRDEEAGEDEHERDELAPLSSSVGEPRRDSASALLTMNAADGDEQRRRHAAVDLAGQQGLDRAGQRGDEVHR